MPDTYQYREFTRACYDAIGVTKHRRDVDFATLRQIAVLEGLLTIEMRRYRATSIDEILALVPEIASNTLLLGKEQQKTTLLRILAHFKIRLEYRTVTRY